MNAFVIRQYETTNSYLMLFILIHRHWQLFGGGIREKWLLFHILSNIVLNNAKLVENRTRYLIREYTLKHKAKYCSSHISGMCKNLIRKVSCEDCLWVAWPGSPCCWLASHSSSGFAHQTST